MTTYEDYWLAMSRGATVVELDPVECRRLLEAKKVGRLALVRDGAPIIMPMNYVLTEDRLVFRTLASGEASRAVDSPVAFEVDDIDDFLEAGWSVVVTGTADAAHRGRAVPAGVGGPDPVGGGAAHPVRGRAAGPGDGAPAAPALTSAGADHGSGPRPTALDGQGPTDGADRRAGLAWSECPDPS